MPVAGMYEGPVAPVTLRLGAPLLAANAVAFLYTVVDTLYISLLDRGSTALISGTGLIVPLYFLFFSLGSGIAAGVSALTARGIGAGDRGVLHTVRASALVLASAIAVLSLLVGLPFTHGIVRLLAGDRMGSAAREFGVQYFRFALPGLAVLLVGQVFLGMLQGEGRTGPVAAAVAISTAVNIGLAPVLMFLLHMGVAGAGLATSISVAAAGVYVLAAAFGSLPPGPRPLRAARGRTIADVVRIGVPQAAGVLALAFTGLVLNKLVGGIGEREMDSWSLVARVDQAASVPVFALAAATLTMAGQNHGRGLLDRVRRVNLVNMLGGAGVMLALAGLYALLAPWIFAGFSSSATVVAGSVAQVRATSFAFAGTAAAAAAAATLMGVGRPGAALVMSLARAGILAAPLAWVLVHLLGWGMGGMFAAVAAANLAGLPVGWIGSRRLLGRS